MDSRNLRQKTSQSRKGDLETKTVSRDNVDKKSLKLKRDKKKKIESLDKVTKEKSS